MAAEKKEAPKPPKSKAGKIKGMVDAPKGKGAKPVDIKKIKGLK